MYVIKDEETGYYVSERSLGKINSKGSKWLYSSYTGWCAGMRDYPSEKYAEQIMNDILNSFGKLGVKINLIVKSVSHKEINHGNYIHKLLVKV